MRTTRRYIPEDGNLPLLFDYICVTLLICLLCFLIVLYFFFVSLTSHFNNINQLHFNLKDGPFPFPFNQLFVNYVRFGFMTGQITFLLVLL
jgi:hypothetical protein